MGKHDKARQEKNERNSLYAARFVQMRCKNCGHKTIKRGVCPVCGERILKNHAERKALKNREKTRKIVDA